MLPLKRFCRHAVKTSLSPGFQSGHTDMLTIMAARWTQLLVFIEKPPHTQVLLATVILTPQLIYPQ